MRVYARILHFLNESSTLVAEFTHPPLNLSVIVSTRTRGSTDAKDMKKCYLLTFSPWLVQPTYKTRDHQSRDGTAHSVLGSLITNLKKILQACL